MSNHQDRPTDEPTQRPVGGRERRTLAADVRQYKLLYILMALTGIGTVLSLAEILAVARFNLSTQLALVATIVQVMIVVGLWRGSMLALRVFTGVQGLALVANGLTAMQGGSASVVPVLVHGVLLVMSMLAGDDIFRRKVDCDEGVLPSIRDAIMANRRLSLGALAVLLVVGVSVGFSNWRTAASKEQARALAASWEEYPLYEFGIAVKGPSEPTESQEGRMTSYEFALRDGFELTLNVEPLRGFAAGVLRMQGAGKALDSARDGLLSALNAEATAETRISLEGNHGCVVDFTDPDGHGRLQVVILEEYVITQFAFAKDPIPEVPEALAFMDSLRLLGPGDFPVE